MPVVATAASLAAADTGTVTVNPGLPVALVARDTAVILGGHYLLQAMAVDREGHVFGPQPATVTSTTPSICSVASDGTVAGLAYGVCRLALTGVIGSTLTQARVVPAGHILVRRGTTIGTLSLDGSGFTKITDIDTTITTNVQWLASGAEIAYWEIVDKGHTRLVISDLQGNQRRMPPLPYPDSPRRLSGDGAWLLVVLRDTAGPSPASVARMRSDGSSVDTVLASCCGASTLTDLSADGSKLAFADVIGGVG